jgi:hypothetical protein
VKALIYEPGSSDRPGEATVVVLVVVGFGGVGAPGRTRTCNLLLAVEYHRE